ncbi:MAG: hypothetical protein Sapg2KO_20330 [Saprospiraceae bacterium]
MKIVIANTNPIHEELESKLSKEYNDLLIINHKHDLNIKVLEEINPDYIFFPHWSFIIPSAIYERYNCVVFHMTDLPYGRGGSPLQNLIVKGHQKTMISALRVVKDIDAGPVYLKKELSLLGTAEEIFMRAGKIIFSMILDIIKYNLKPKSQIGEVVPFKRRTPQQSNISKLESLEEVFDFIRMLDAENYPNAFLETQHLRFEFSRASLKKDKIIADVRIIEK